MSDRNTCRRDPWEKGCFIKGRFEGSGSEVEKLIIVDVEGIGGAGRGITRMCQNSLIGQVAMECSEDSNVRIKLGNAGVVGLVKGKECGVEKSIGLAMEKNEWATEVGKKGNKIDMGIIVGEEIRNLRSQSRTQCRGMFTSGQ